jgi:hypothetical protein
MTLDLDQIRARAAAATGGPWKLVTDSCDCGDGYGCPHGEFPYAIRLPEHTVQYAERACNPDEPGDHYHHDASEIVALTMETVEFIVHARTDVPALLAEIDQIRAERDTAWEVAHDNKLHAAELAVTLDRFNDLIQNTARGNRRHVAELAVTLDRFNDLIHDTDGDELDGGEGVPADEIRRVLHEPVRLTEAHADQIAESLLRRGHPPTGVTTTLTIDAVNEIMAKHNDFWHPDSVLSNEDVRQYARYLRFAAQEPDADYDDNMVQAAELDLLVDRAEVTGVATR